MVYQVAVSVVDPNVSALASKQVIVLSLVDKSVQDP